MSHGLIHPFSKALYVKNEDGNIVVTDGNLQGIFKKDAYKEKSRVEIDPERALKDFKVFTFSCRSGLTNKAPVGWDITNESELGLLNDVINKTFSIDDMIDSVS
mgnify:CR=1 FL=1